MQGPFGAVPLVLCDGTSKFLLERARTGDIMSLNMDDTGRRTGLENLDGQLIGPVKSLSPSTDAAHLYANPS